MKKRFWSLLIFLVFLAFSLVNAGTVKNVIFFIGDGCGISIIDVSRTVLVGKEGYLSFEEAPYIGLQKTYSANTLVTDSAAAGTALATGFKTNNGYLSITPDGKPVKTLLEAAKEKGKATGVITTVTITHATPAAFAAHTTSRDELPIADQYAQFKSADIYMGGGLSYFIPQSSSSASKRKDERNLVAEFKDAGYEFVSTPTDLEKSTAPLGKLLGLFSNEQIPYYIDREYEKASVPTLAQMTEKALEILNRNPNGFFIMIEGGKIDWANHGHDPATAVWEVYEFNEAIKVALDFLKENPDTLIIITADHETGGIGLSTGKYEYTPDILKGQKVSAEVLTRLVKDKSDEDIKKIFTDFVGILDLKLEELEKIKTAKALTIGDIISARAQIGWSTTTHSGQSIPVYAFGEEAQHFAGVYENTDIARLIAKSAGLVLSQPKEIKATSSSR